MKKSLLLILSLILSVSLLYGCYATATKDAETLRSRTNAYGKLIRWKAYDDASRYIQRRDGGSVEINTELLNEVRVTGYEVVGMVMNESSDEATVMAEISYYHERVNSVQDIRDQEIWYKDKDTGVWYLDGQLPPFVR